MRQQHEIFAKAPLLDESGKLQAILVDAECESPRLGIADFHVGCIDRSVHFAQE